eukprot:12358773-Alexandrium_andersonii.AAC.1
METCLSLLMKHLRPFTAFSEAWGGSQQLQYTREVANQLLSALCALSDERLHARGPYGKSLSA